MDERAPGEESPTLPAPKSFSVDALATIGVRAKAVCEQTEAVCLIETALFEFEQANRKLVQDYSALRSKLADARRKLAETQTEALKAIGWQVRR